MRRKDRQVTDKDQLQAIIDQCDICRLGLYDGQEVYILPANFGYSWQGELPVLYFHGATKGRKLEIIAQNPRAAFEMDCSHQLVTGDAPCDWSMEYQSIVGQGVLEVVEDEAERLRGLDLLMQKHGYRGNQGYDPNVLKRTFILRLTVTQMSGKGFQNKADND